MGRSIGGRGRRRPGLDEIPRPLDTGAMTRPSPDAYGFDHADGVVDPADVGTALHLLRHGRLSIEGRLVAASNATMYCSVELDGLRSGCVYKPVSGERPLWDFP